MRTSGERYGSFTKKLMRRACSPRARRWPARTQSCRPRTPCTSARSSHRRLSKNVSTGHLMQWPARPRATASSARPQAQTLLLASRSSPVLARELLRLLACPDNSSRVQSCCQFQVGGDSDRAVCVRAATLTSSSRRTPSAACLTSIPRPRPRAAGSLPPTPSPHATRATGSEFSAPLWVLPAAQARVDESCSRASAGDQQTHSN